MQLQALQQLPTNGSAEMRGGDGLVPARQPAACKDAGRSRPRPGPAASWLVVRPAHHFLASLSRPAYLRSLVSTRIFSPGAIKSGTIISRPVSRRADFQVASEPPRMGGAVSAT